MSSSASLPVAGALKRRQQTEEWKPIEGQVVVGKDILELLSSSMYVDPLTIYREYIQNAADAIDAARVGGALTPDAVGRVDITVNLADRSVRIRDNGIGVSSRSFATRMTSIGASTKRGTNARGFRGVGRLAGLGYCQELVFRSKAPGDKQISELRWDCRRFKELLRSSEFQQELPDLVRQIASGRRATADGYPEHFFEIELNGIVRHKSDRLLSGLAISEYLAQVAPVPCSPSFGFGSAIDDALRQHGIPADLHIHVDGNDQPIYRPYANEIEVGEGQWDKFTDFQIHEIPGVDGGVAAVAWILHHGYTGAIPAKTLVKGLRLRSGNIQVGDQSQLEELFPEPRFNAWSVGEVHIIDRRIVPNGRRDDFEHGVHFHNILNHLAPIARDIAKRCRLNSQRRKALREFELCATSAREGINVLRQGSLGTGNRRDVVRAVGHDLAKMEKIARMDGLGVDPIDELVPTVTALRAELNDCLGQTGDVSPLARLPAAKRRMYEQLFGLIYECSTNRIAAKALVDRIMLKIV
jgi:molecular chaperone HtpG